MSQAQHNNSNYTDSNEYFLSETKSYLSQWLENIRISNYGLYNTELNNLVTFSSMLICTLL